MSYEFTSRVRYSEIGPDGRLTLSGLVNYLQDCAVFHSESIGYGPEVWARRQASWIITSWQIVINEFPKLAEEVTTKTWSYFLAGMVYSDEIEDKIDLIIDKMKVLYPNLKNYRWYAIKQLEKDREISSKYPVEMPDVIDRSYEDDIITQKYDFIEEIVEECLVNKATKEAKTDRADRILTNKWLGLPIFLGIMEKERRNFVHGNPEEGVPGCISRGIKEEVADRIFDEMSDFANYAFNKSHAAAYAVVSFQTAYLKYYHPVEFMIRFRMMSDRNWKETTHESKRTFISDTERFYTGRDSGNAGSGSGPESQKEKGNLRTFPGT